MIRLPTQQNLFRYIQEVFNEYSLDTFLQDEKYDFLKEVQVKLLEIPESIKNGENPKEYRLE